MNMGKRGPRRRGTARPMPTPEWALCACVIACLPGLAYLAIPHTRVQVLAYGLPLLSRILVQSDSNVCVLGS
jgi:hypothetical protein